MKLQEISLTRPVAPPDWLAGGFPDRENGEPPQDEPSREARNAGRTSPCDPPAIWPRVFPGL